jgi:trehalose 6-phosphate phosphatase
MTEAGRTGLAAILDDPATALFAFDYDGVLAPIVVDPTNSPPHPRAVPALARVAALVGSVVVISGRPAQVVVDYAQFASEPALSDLVVFGHYGHQRWDARTGRLTTAAAPEALAEVRRELPGLLLRHGVRDAWIEDKGASVAVHTRRSTDPDAALAALTSPIADYAKSHGLRVEPGRYVLEIRPPGVDKGQTLLSFAEERSPHSICYLGDDLGDLPAFDAVQTLRNKGLAGLTVCSGSAEVAEVARRADLVVDGPAGVVALLEGFADALSSSRTSMGSG